MTLKEDIRISIRRILEAFKEQGTKKLYVSGSEESLKFELRSFEGASEVEISEDAENFIMEVVYGERGQKREA